MASSPRKNQSGNYFITWSDSSRKQRQKSESLQTKKLGEARERKAALETLYKNGYHDPWEQSWHRNHQIKGFVYSGVIDLHKLAKKKVVSSISTIDAANEYINYKLKHDWKSQSTKEYPKTLRRFVRRLPEYVDELTQDDFLDLLASYDNDFTYAHYAGTLNTFIGWLEKYGLKINKIPYNQPTHNIPEFIYNEHLKAACFAKIEAIKKSKKYKPGITQRWMIFGWLIMRYTGMRPNELIRIKKTDVNLDRQEIRVGSWFKTKTRNQRKIPVFEELVPVMELLLDDSFRAKDRSFEGELLLGQSFYQKKRLGSEFKECSGHVLYWLRNTFAMWFLTKENTDAAWHFYQLKKYMGHSKISQTEKYLDALPYKMDKDKLHDVRFIDEILAKVISL